MSNQSGFIAISLLCIMLIIAAMMTDWVYQYKQLSASFNQYMFLSENNQPISVEKHGIYYGNNKLN